LAPAEAVLRNAGDTQSDFIVDGLVHVDRRPIILYDPAVSFTS
jgi:hypothetical protein